MNSTKCEKCCNCECNKKFFSLPLNKTRSNRNNGSSYAIPNSHSHVYEVAPIQQNPKKPILGVSNRNVYSSASSTVKMKPKCGRHSYGAGNQKPFNPYCCETPRLFTAPPVIPHMKGKAITTSIRNYDAGTKRQFAVVPQGVELYHENPVDDDIRISRAEFEKLVSKTWTMSSVATEEREKYPNSNSNSSKGRKCTELDKPKFNTTRKSVREIQEAIGHLRNIPIEIETYVKNDPFLQQKIKETATKKINMPLEGRIYKDLLSIQQSEVQRLKSAEEIRKEMQALQPPPKPRDPEPNILMFNKPTYSRIKPKLPGPPSKPQKGVSTDVTEDFFLIKSEFQFSEKESNASLLNTAVDE